MPHNHCDVILYPLQVMMFFNSKDKDRDGKISYDEFCDRETITERAFKVKWLKYASS